MSLSRAEVIDYLEGLTSLELGELIDGLQQRLGLTVTPTPQVFTTMGAPLLTDEVPELTRRVRLTEVGPRKVRVLQALREHVPLPLHDAVHLLETMPVIVASGLRPDLDIPIVFSGLRAGEKMCEELSAYEENTVSTPHSQIRVFTGPALDRTGLERSLTGLRDALRARDAASAVLILKDLVPDYNPSHSILHEALLTKPRKAA